MDIIQLHKILDEMYFYMKNLEPVLDKEQYLLSQGRIDGSLLQGVTQQKEMMLASITSLNKRRMALHESAGFEEPYDKVNNYAITHLWQSISLLADKIAKQNMNNGLLLQFHISYANEAISILEQEAGSPVYGPNGQTTMKSKVTKKYEV